LTTAGPMEKGKWLNSEISLFSRPMARERHEWNFWF
jgi:hypothetical protein